MPGDPVGKAASQSVCAPTEESFHPHGVGQIGHPAAKEPLKALLNDPNPDVREIAEEALEEIG